MQWEFELHEKVYDKSRNQNGVVVIRRYTEEPSMAYRSFYVTYWPDSGNPVTEWSGAEYLESGHRSIID